MEVCVNKKQKYLGKDELEKLSKDALITRILQLEAHNKQLKNILNKTLKNECSNSKSSQNQDETIKKRTFDFSKCHKRHVLLKFLYFGWDYQGFASQEDTQATIEHYLFAALQRTCLIEKRENSNYNRCGRTDKGVSAFCQVISIDLRSKFPEDEQLQPENISNEIDYCGILNKILPSNIKCITWMPLKNKVFSARFDCIQRTYKYFFPVGNLNIQAMQEACTYLVGKHDFRNLCKMDVANGVQNFTRSVFSAEIKSCCNNETKEMNSYTMKYFQIISQSFLWHQIRCIMAVLILIGQEHEKPSVIKDLLNIQENPCKPQYTLANGLPLNLYSCEFRNKSLNTNTVDNSKKLEKDDISMNKLEIDDSNDANNNDTTKWIYNKENLYKLLEDLQEQWSIQSVKTSMIREVITDIQELFLLQFENAIIPENQISALLPIKQKQYQKLLTRKRCESLENRLDHYIKKQRLTVSKSTNSK